MSRVSYILTFGGTIVVSLFFGFPFVGWLRDWAVGMLNPSGLPWWPVLTGALYICGIFGIALTKPSKNDQYDTVRKVAIGMLLLAALGAFSPTYDGKELMALIMPLLVAAAIFGAFEFMKQQDRLKLKQVPPQEEEIPEYLKKYRTKGQE